MRLEEWITDEANAAKYRAWRDNPDTQLILQLMENELVPTPLPPQAIDTNQGLAAYSELVGAHRVMRRLKYADQGREVPSNELLLTYGLKKILKEQGYTDTEAERILSEGGMNAGSTESTE